MFDRSSPPTAANETTATIVGVSDWAEYDSRSATSKATAERRLSILAGVEALTAAGTGKTAAMMAVARERGISMRSVASWFAFVRGSARGDRLPRLAPQYRGGGRKAKIDDVALRILAADYRRSEKPTFASCYSRLIRDYANPGGIILPHAKTLKRRLDSLAKVERSARS